MEKQKNVREKRETESQSQLNDLRERNRIQKENNKEYFYKGVRNSGNQKRNTICKFFLEGWCKKGWKCEYSHPRSNGNMYVGECWRERAGYCKFGNQCKYTHRSGSEKGVGNRRRNFIMDSKGWNRNWRTEGNGNLASQNIGTNRAE